MTAEFDCQGIPPSHGFDIVVVGSCFVDMLWYVPRLPKRGETINASKFQIDFGGKASNQCAMSTKLGAKTAMITMVGKDKFGADAIQNFKKLGVNTDFILTHDKATTSITIDSEGQPGFISLAGSNKLITIDDIKPALQALKFPVLVCDKGIPLSTATQVLKLGKQMGAQTIFNPAPRIEKLDPEAYHNIHLMVINGDEGEGLTGIHVSDVESAKDVIREIHRRGTKSVVLTLGKNGAVCSHDGNGLSMVHIKARKVTVFDTTGAGDALLGSLAYYLACHSSMSFPEMVARAVDIATTTVTKDGVQSSYPYKKDLPEGLFAKEEVYWNDS